jgi:hypothetical protein
VFFLINKDASNLKHLPDLKDILKGAAKTLLCSSGIIWSPICTLFSPKVNRSIFELAGFSIIVKGRDFNVKFESADDDSFVRNTSSDSQ